MTDETFPNLVHTLQLTTTTGLIFIAGLSSCLSLWVIPLTELLPPHLAATQFRQTFTWGKQWLQPSSRLLGAMLLATVFLTAQLPDPAQAAKWKDWAFCLAVLAPVAPYEVFAIFWINDRVEEIVGEMRSGGGEGDMKRELGVLLEMWRRRNFGRVGIPLAAGMVGLWSLARDA